MDQERYDDQQGRGQEEQPAQQQPDDSADGQAGGQEERPPEEDEARYNPDSVARYYEQYYNYPYYGKPVRRGWPRWATVLIIVLVVVLGGCGTLAWFAWRGFKNLGLFPSIPPAKVHTGTALNWRELDSWPGSGGGPMTPSYSLGGSGLSAADFDGDGNEDLLTMIPISSFAISNQQWRIYSVAAGQQLFNIQSSQIAMVAAPWDYQADGTMEVAADQFGGIQILNTSGQVLTSLAGSWQSQRPLLGDLDGDGHDELLLYDSMTSALSAYDAQCNLVWSTPMANYWMTFAGDVDGDGQDEVITESGFGLTAAGPGQAPAPLSGWQPSTQHSGAMGGYICADLNGDGTDEVIAADEGYLDPVSNTMTSFSWPSSGTMPSYAWNWSIGAVPFDLDGDGTPEIAVAASRNSAGYGTGTGIYVFDLQGTLVYYEEFGTTVHGLTVARAGGRDYLAVLLNDRLIAYP